MCPIQYRLKMSGKRIVLLLVFLAAAALAEKTRFDNYQVFKIVPRTNEDLKLLALARTTTPDFNFWNEPTLVNRPVSVMVPPHFVDSAKNFMTVNRLDAKLTIPNVQKLIDQEENRMKKSPRKMEWTEYHTLEEINEWLETVASETGNLATATVVQVGTTYEDRPINGLLITHGDENLPGVIFESGIHAREWIAPAATSWIVDKILHEEDSDSVWHKFNYLYIPSVNPDGYEFTHNKNRMWRKSRKPYMGGLCYGADINRNWDSHWMEGGASSNPCAEDFAGSEPASEVETETIAEYYKKNSGKYDIYISFHSFSQLLMFPWGYTGDSTPLTPTWQRVGDAAAEALEKVHGKHFDVGNIHDTIYPASGSSIEYFYDKYNSTLTYTFECRDTGDWGFLLPPDQIIPSGEELKAAVQVMLEEYQKLSKRV